LVAVACFLPGRAKDLSAPPRTIRRNEFVVNILEGATSGKMAVGRPRPQYLKLVTRNTGADSFTAMKKWLATIPDGKLPTNQKIEG
jgi:hypothetical protein